MEHYNVVVIGGGIHGAGTAQAMSAAGYKVLLLEKKQLANGSSSRSSKLIHGGLRYLESAQFSLVHECLYERHLLTQIAPELVRLENFYIPVYGTTSRSRFTLRMGLSIYALLGGLKKSTRFHSLASSKWSSLDGLKQDDLRAVYQYMDGRTDDKALTRAVMQSAIELGAQLAMPAEMQSAQVEPDRVNITYDDAGISKQVTTDLLVNTAGPWVNKVLENITPLEKGINIDLVQGAHLLLDNLPIQHCFYLESPHDRRAIFLLPWKDKTLIGTTETTYQGIPDNVVALEKEKQYLLDVVYDYFPNHTGFSVSDSFAGLRVLPAEGEDHFSKSRDTILKRSHPRVINVYGGKLTTYRLVSERIVQQCHDVLPQKKIIISTDKLMLNPV